MPRRKGDNRQQRLQIQNRHQQFTAKGADKMQAMTEPKIIKTERQPREAGSFTKRLGSTTYRVRVHFSATSKETANDKIARLVRSEAAAGKAANL
jgi:hypothetical protein